MRLGLFDFGKKREEDPAEGQDSVAVDLDSPRGASFGDGAGADLTAEDIADLWDSLASELDELSLDELDEQLQEAPAVDPELQPWADVTDERALRQLVDSFVDDATRRETPPEWQPLADSEEGPGGNTGHSVEHSGEGPQEQVPEDDSEAVSGPGQYHSPVAGRHSLDARMRAADLLSDLMDEEERDYPDQWERVEEASSTDRAAGILKRFHQEEEPEAVEDDGSRGDLHHSNRLSNEHQDELSLELPARPGASSAVVSDEVVLALMHAGVVRVAQVYEASRHRRNGEPLWRAILDVADIDRAKVLAEVAAQAEYPVVEASDRLPVKNLVDNMRETLTAGEVTALLSARALPVEIGIDPQTLGYKLVLVSDDPASDELAQACGQLSMDTECRYMETGSVDRYLDLVWPDRPPRSPRPPLADAEPPPGVGSPRADRPAVPGQHDVDWEAPQPAEEPLYLAPEEAETVEAPAPEPVSEAPGVEQSLDLLDRRARKDRVVAALFKEGSVSVEQVEKALQAFGLEGGKEAIWRLMASVPGVDRDKIFSMAAKVYAFSRVEIGPGQPDHEFVMLIMETIAEARREDLLRLNLLPYEYAIDPDTGGARLIFVTHDPARSEVHRILSQLKLGRFELRYAEESALTRVVTEIFPRRNEYLDRMTGNEAAFDLGTEYQTEDSDLVDETALEAEMSRSSLINLFEASLIEAVRRGASDIHVFPNPKRHIEIHFRVDGRLKRWHVDEKIAAEAFLAVVKDNSTNIDRFERDMAQDGFIQRRIDDILIRFRVSVLPIATANQEIRAESIVIRVLDDRKVLTDLSKLGMLESAMERVAHAISQPHGMIILTGPTGSGKSTTLVAALYQVISPEVNVLTIEDPVEYIINGVRQIKLGNKLGLEDAIRAVLRHDPDIVMVGEMRDKATADLAIKLANTGHLTFSTLHTNDAPSAVSRLYKMGVEPFLLAYAINLIVAQRLIRQLCPTCKRESASKDHVLMERLGFSPEEIESMPVFEPGRHEKCATCNGAGYKGRRAISETLYFSQAIRHIVAESGEDIDEEAIKEQAVKEGMLTLQDCARELVRQGVTSLDEMMRVTASE